MEYIVSIMIEMFGITERDKILCSLGQVLAGVPFKFLETISFYRS